MQAAAQLFAFGLRQVIDITPQVVDALADAARGAGAGPRLSQRSGLREMHAGEGDAPPLSAFLLP